MITSRKNTTVQTYRAALAGKDAAHWVLEGPRLLDEALRSGVQLVSVLYLAGSPHFEGELKQRCESDGIACHPVTEAVLEVVSETASPQGLAALARTRTTSLEELAHSDRLEHVVVAAGVQNPGNLGTLIRSAEAFGATALVTLEGTAGLYRPATIRGAMGSLFRLPCARVTVLQELIEALKHHTKIALDPSGNTGLRELEPKTPLALFVGSEAHGLPAELLNVATHRVRIEQRSSVESLSVATAAGIALYEIWKSLPS